MKQAHRERLGKEAWGMWVQESASDDVRDWHDLSPQERELWRSIADAVMTEYGRLLVEKGIE